MPVNTDHREFELQFFNGTKYVAGRRGKRRELEPAFEAGAPAIRRLVACEKAWPARPKYYKPSGSRGPGMDKDQTIEAYLGWARSKGLDRVHVYEGVPVSLRIKPWAGIDFIPVPVESFLGPAPAAEPDE